ncbi:MAG: butyrate kinase [Firmicutes bacterium]|nr:butyrate kinase [Bacillota bacterium]
MKRIIVLNFGGTSSKCAVYEDGKCVSDYEIKYTAEEENLSSDGKTQVAHKKQVILAWLDSIGLSMKDFDAVAIRGGGAFNGAAGGTYKVEDDLYDHLLSMYTPDAPPMHAARTTIAVADALIAELPEKPPIFSTDPCSVSQMPEYARVTGCPKFRKRSSFHALNQRAVARIAAEDLGKTYETAKIIVAHLGGGISIGAHENGRVVEVNDSTGDGDGPFSANRAGTVPTGQLVHLCFSGEYTEQQVLNLLKKDSGLKGYLGTSDLREVEKRIDEGDQQAKLIFDAMAYQICSQIGICYAAMRCECDAIVITAGMSKSKRLVAAIEERVGKMAPVKVYSGEYENQALALGALRVLNGEEKASEYTGEAGYMQPVTPWKK